MATQQQTPPPPPPQPPTKIQIIRTPEEARAALEERMRRITPAPVNGAPAPPAAVEPKQEAPAPTPGLPEDTGIQQNLIAAAKAINQAVREADAFIAERRVLEDHLEDQRETIRALRIELNDARVANVEGKNEEAAPLKERIEELEKRNATLEAAIQDAAKDYEIRDEMIALLEKQVEEAQIATLDRLATELPQYPRLAMIAQEVSRERAKALRIEQDVLARLPVHYDWRNERGTIRYQPHFTSALREMRSEEQAQILKAITNLSFQGPSLPGLQTKMIDRKLPYTPPGGFYSRASGELRFSWMKLKGEVVIYWAYRKGESRLRQKE